MGQKTSLRAIICCMVIIFGFLLGVVQEDTEGTLSINWVFFGILASLFASVLTSRDVQTTTFWIEMFMTAY
jgi:solute carrier family 35 (GDP-fucose transporter), member C1